MQTRNREEADIMRKAVRKSTFEKIREPQIVGNPGIPAHMDMVMLGSGEIRHDGVRIFEHEDGSKAFEFVMKQSFDSGLSWEETPVHGDHPGPSVKSPWSGDFFVLLRVLRPTYDLQWKCRCFRRRTSDHLSDRRADKEIFRTGRLERKPVRKYISE